MKNRKALLTTLALFISLIVTAIPVNATQIQAQDESTDDYDVVLRMYNPNTGEHFYTENLEERKFLHMVGWEAEGIGWVAPKKSDTPIYRLYSGTEHFYTDNAKEARHLATIGWSGEGIEFYSDDNKSVPMYRLYNPNATVGSHHYTSNAAERDLLISLGWQDEGIGWYALPIDTSEIELPELPSRYKNTIENAPSYAAIEADVKLSGTGSGHHAKVLFQTPTSAVSFGIQHDEWAKPPYTGTTFFLCENVKSNDPGGQEYTYYGASSKDVYHHILLTYNQGGYVTFYVDGELIGMVQNENLTKDDLYVSAEGAARLEGDSVSASFRNIRLKKGGKYIETQTWNPAPIATNPGMHVAVSGFDTKGSMKTGFAEGIIEGIGDLDWDSAYDRVSGVIIFGKVR